MNVNVGIKFIGVILDNARQINGASLTNKNANSRERSQLLICLKGNGGTFYSVTQHIKRVSFAIYMYANFYFVYVTTDRMTEQDKTHPLLFYSFVELMLAMKMNV